MLALALLASHAAVDGQSSDPVKPKRIFRGQWWDYYERGLLQSERGDWKAAIEDFKAARRRRDTEGRAARTYGVEFIEYFPARELGVALYHDGQYQPAVEALERSLKTGPTAKAAYYFNLARAALLRQRSPDPQPPRIKIQAPPDEFLTSSASVEVRGTVESRNSVAEVEINGEPVLIETAPAMLPFAHRVSLAAGRNTIEVVARDLVGRESRQTRVVIVDREGPVVVIDRLLRGADGRLRLHGAVYDNVRLGTLHVEDQAVPLVGQTESPFVAEVPGLGSSVLVEAVDAAGNVTRVRLPIPLDLRQPGARRAAITLVTSRATMTFPVAMQARPPLSIDVEPVPQHVQQETMAVSWLVTSTAPLASVSINDEPKTIRRSDPGRPHVFSHILWLTEGVNTVSISATDGLGRTASALLHVTRKVEEVEQLGSRLSVAVLPFESKGRPSELYEGAYDALVDALVNQGRFKIVSRVQLDSILKELKLSRSGLVDPATAIRAGRLVAAEAIMVGTVNETSTTAEVYVQLISTETSTVLGAKDVFDPAKSAGTARLKMRELAAKIRQDYPLVSGAVIEVRHARLVVGVGRQKRVRPDMRMIVYLEGSPIIDPQTRAVLDRNIETLGEAVTTEVRPALAFCAMKGPGLGRVEALLGQKKTIKVITK